MGDNVERAVGELHGKMDALITAFGTHVAEENRRHERLDEKVARVEAHVNQVKGARGMLVTLAGAVGAGITLAAEKLWK